KLLKCNSLISRYLLGIIPSSLLAINHQKGMSSSDPDSGGPESREGAGRRGGG
ncbi:MAG: hypothetical protein RJA81_2049, partial [Planctomycetota bacterium]